MFSDLIIGPRTVDHDHAQPQDSYGHYLSPDGEPLTDPYGHLSYTIGNGDDLHCLDIARLEDGCLVLHSVVNSETGGFIQDSQYFVVRPQDALDAARSLIDAAWDWLYSEDAVDMRGSVRASRQCAREYLASVRRFVWASEESEIQFQPNGHQRCHACHRVLGRLSHRTGGFYYHVNHVPGDKR